MSELVRASSDEPGSDEERRVRFVEDLRRELRRQMTEEQAMAYEGASPLDLSWLGLARYWRKRGVGLSPEAPARRSSSPGLRGRQVGDLR